MTKVRLGKPQLLKGKHVWELSTLDILGDLFSLTCSRKFDYLLCLD